MTDNKIITIPLGPEHNVTIRVVDKIPVQKYYSSSYMSPTALYLEWFTCDQDDFDLVLNELNDEHAPGIYEKITELYINNDGIQEVPESILNFKNLQSIQIGGARFWNITMKNIPPSIQVIKYDRHSNLNQDCLEGAEKLLHLKFLSLDLGEYFPIFQYINSEEYEGKYCIPDLPELETVRIEMGHCFSSSDLLPDYINIIKNHPIMKDISHRIVDISISNYETTRDYNGFWGFIITLSPHS